MGDADLADFAKKAPLNLALKSGLFTHIGHRAQNEDYAAICLAPDGQAGEGAVAAIADGVGGESGGRVAAELAVRSFIEGQFGQSELLGVRRIALRSLDAINAWIHAIGGRDPQLAGMASTFTGLVLRNRRGFLLHVGDTRLYRLRDSRLELLTTDHTFRLPGYRNVLTRAIGTEVNVKVDYSEISLAEHDRYLFCTDGVHGCVSDARLRALLEQRASADDAAREIVDASLAAGGDDNATALVVDVIALTPSNMTELSSAFAAKPILRTPRVGDTVDGFHLTRLLAEGRYSCVFEARDESTGRLAVLKFPKPKTAPDAIFRKIFMRETWVASNVRSPYVGKTLEIPDDRKSAVYLAMPFYDGETLDRRLSRRPPLSLTAGLDVALKLAKGVAALHRAGIIHRDIKPDNVVLEPARRNEPAGLKLIDLGVARLPYVEDLPDLATAGNRNAPGTPSYMAPELFSGSPGDELSDQFALGVTIYRMFTGAYPYGEIEPFTHPRFRDAVPLQKRRPDLPAWLDRAIGRAIAVNPSERFHDVLELAFELEHGAMRPTEPAAETRSLYEHNPVAFWKGTAALLFVALVLALIRLAAPHVVR